MKRVSIHRLGAILLFVLLSSVSFAQEKTQSYYNTHESEILPDAKAAFQRGDYERTIELCKWHYIILGDHKADNLRQQAEKCLQLTKEIQSLQYEATREKVKSLLELNPNDPRGKEMESSPIPDQEKTPPGYIKVSSVPAGAIILLDGKDTGLTTPDILDNVSPGKHIVSLVLDGYDEYKSTVPVSSGQRVNLSPTLAKNKSKASASNAGNLSKNANRVSNYEWVDLGLSVKWATCNIGASSPEDPGVYFSWGETTSKKDYDWGRYKYGLKSSGKEYSKYVTDPDYGATDNKSRLEVSDDAAHAIWGGDWRIPTISEMEELIDKCVWTWVRQGDLEGYRITSTRNGNSIFLPAAGAQFQTGLFQLGTHGYYWSSTLNTVSPFMAYGIGFEEESINSDSAFRAYGRSIRPVLDK